MLKPWLPVLALLLALPAAGQTTERTDLSFDCHNVACTMSEGLQRGLRNLELRGLAIDHAGMSVAMR
ncbi:MAG: hypothetical protein K2Q10_02520, partial [Rhodospirillales bacterium]|nr:hypothetical protein [Rhodospirillales bacterium]